MSFSPNTPSVSANLVLMLLGSASSSKASRRVSFQEHNESLGGIDISELAFTPKPHSLITPPFEEESSPSKLAAARKMPAAKTPVLKLTRQVDLRKNDDTPSTDELLLAKRRAEQRASIAAKLAETLEQRNNAKMMEQKFEELKDGRVMEAKRQQDSWDVCPNAWGTITDANGERLKRPAYNALMDRLHGGGVSNADDCAVGTGEHCEIIHRSVKLEVTVESPRKEVMVDIEPAFSLQVNVPERFGGYYEESPTEYAKTKELSQKTRIAEERLRMRRAKAKRIELAEADFTGLPTRPSDWNAFATQSSVATRYTISLPEHNEAVITGLPTRPADWKTFATQPPVAARSIISPFTVPARTDSLQRPDNTSARPTFKAKSPLPRAEAAAADISKALVRTGTMQNRGHCSVLPANSPVEIFQNWAAGKYGF